MGRGAWVAPGRPRAQPGMWNPQRARSAPATRSTPPVAAKLARTSAPRLRAGVRSSIHEQVAARRFAKAGLRAPVERDHLLRRSVGPTTEETYRVAITDFREWPGPREATSGNDLDKHLPNCKARWRRATS